jgi:hypothetical protein
LFDLDFCFLSSRTKNKLIVSFLALFSYSPLGFHPEG